MIVTQVIYAHGHENVRSTNRTTFEITKDKHLTRRGDCIIVVGATKGAADLNQEFKEAAENEDTRIKILIETRNEAETVNAWGSPKLSFTHPTDLVVRKSDYVCGRTIAIRADKAAKDLSGNLVQKLCNPNERVRITLTAESAI